MAFKPNQPNRGVNRPTNPNAIQPLKEWDFNPIQSQVGTPAIGSQSSADGASVNPAAPTKSHSTNVPMPDNTEPPHSGGALYPNQGK